MSIEIDSTELKKVEKTYQQSDIDLSGNFEDNSYDPECSIKTLFDCRIVSSVSETDFFIHRAIESLVKRLKSNKNELNNFVLTISEVKSANTPCACILRTLDGRLQIAGKKGFPHVIYAKIWRWSNVTNAELYSLPTCRFPFDQKLPLVCVNPYHYELKKISLTTTDPSINSLSTINSESIMKNKMDGFAFLTEPQSFAMTTPSQNSQFITGTNNVGFEINVPIDPNLDLPTTAISGPNYSNFQNPINAFSESFENVLINDQKNWSNDVVTVSSNRQMDHWCSVIYHEFDMAVGEAFKVPLTSSSFTIDGYFDLVSLTKIRMSLGQFTNIHRTEASERTRMYIGKGIQFELVNHEIYLSCLSDSSIFVENYYLDEIVDKPYGSVVHKIYPRAYVKFFDFDVCYNSMKKLLTTISSNSASLPITSSSTPDRTVVNSLIKYCGARISFVKGWGPDYPRRHISNTPCWIEIVFTEAVLMMNELLETFYPNQKLSFSAKRINDSQI